MLQSIRDKAQGWIAWVIVILITIPFALWGIQEYLGVGSEPVVVKVNDREITDRELETAARNFRAELRERLGAQYKPEMFEESLIRKQVLESMIRDTLIQQAAKDLGLRAGDLMVRQTITSIPALQVAGQFNTEAYKTYVQRQGMTEKAFEENLRATLMTRQLEMALQQSAFVTDATLQDIAALEGQERTLAYITLSTSQLADNPEFSDAELKKYYQDNSSKFMSPERVKLEYLVLNIDAIRKNITVKDEDLKAYFNQHKDEFIVPDKKRVSHILLEEAENTAPEEVEKIKAEAEAIHDRLIGGDSFAELAKEKSQDIGSASAGGDLGFIEDPTIFDPAFIEAVSSLGENEISQPVRTRYGFHIIQVTEVIAGDKGDFAAVKEQVRKQYIESEAEQIYYDYAERLGNLVYETPDSLEPAANELKLELKKSDWITRDGGQGLLASPKVISAAFSEEVISQGYNSEPLELDTNELLVLRAVEHQDRTLKDFDSVKVLITEQLKTESMFARLQKHAAEMLQRLNQGETLQQLATEENLTVSDADAVTRDASSVPAAIREQAFTAPRPAEGKASYVLAELSDEEIAVIAVTAVENGQIPDDKDQVQSARMKQAYSLGADEFDLYVENLRKRASIEYTSSP